MLEQKTSFEPKSGYGHLMRMRARPCARVFGGWRGMNLCIDTFPSILQGEKGAELTKLLAAPFGVLRLGPGNNLFGIGVW